MQDTLENLRTKGWLEAIENLQGNPYDIKVRKEEIKPFAIQFAVENGFRTIEKAQELNCVQLWSLNLPAAQDALKNELMTFQQFLNLKLNNMTNLKSPYVQLAVKYDLVKFEQAFNFSTSQWVNLSSIYVRNAIKDGLITFEQALNLDSSQKLALENNNNPLEMVKKLREGELGIKTGIPSLKVLCAFFIKKNLIPNQESLPTDLEECLAKIKI